jgi:hypothetical protein
MVQGPTEFLPISGTVHLRIVPALPDWPDPRRRHQRPLPIADWEGPSPRRRDQAAGVLEIIR